MGGKVIAQSGYRTCVPMSSDEEKPVRFSSAGLTYLIEVSGLVTKIGLVELLSRLELNFSLSFVVRSQSFLVRR